MKLLLHGEYTERLMFAELTKKYYEELIPFFSHANTVKFLGLGDIPTAEKRCETWFDKCDYRIKNNLGNMNALIDRHSGKFVGQCGLLVQEVDNITELEIGYSILPKYWNMSYASEAAKKCKSYAFEHQLAKSLISIVHVENLASAKVAEKNGMQKEKQTFFQGSPVNIFRIHLNK